MDSPSPFTAAELARWRDRLVDQARSLRSDIDAVDGETVLQERVSPNHHLAEGGSELQTVVADVSAAVEDQELLRLVLRAVHKLDTGLPVPFGICEVSGREIEDERLDLMPWTPVCADVGECLERQGMPLADVLVDEPA